jgi:hypothetical protein
MSIASILSTARFSKIFFEVFAHSLLCNQIEEKIFKMDPSFGEFYEKSSMNCGNPKYERESFDRFCDDFCELILSYLEMDDKIRLQFVNSQWRRCIFNRVYQFDYPLELNDFGVKVSKRNETLKWMKIF